MGKRDVFKTVYCKVCNKKIELDNPLEIERLIHWVEEEGCWMCDNCYAHYDGQTLEKLKEEIKEIKLYEEKIKKIKPIINQIDILENNNIKKTKANLCMGLSDLHFGHESCLHDTYWFTINKMLKEIEMLKNRYEIINPYLILNGDIVGGSMIYRNQYLESQVQKNESIVMLGSYLVHLTIKKIEKVLGKPIKTFVVIGNHEGSYRPLPHNFALGIARRLSAYKDNVRYTSEYLILNLARGFNLPDYNILAFHSWGGADYSSASPSVVREMTRAHSQLATHKGIIIQRFLIGHTHWLEVGRSVLGIRFDVLGGFMRWSKTISFRESGMLYYIYNEYGDLDARPISGLKMQLQESSRQDLHFKNMSYVANTLENAIEHELKLGILQERIKDEELR